MDATVNRQMTEQHHTYFCWLLWTRENKILFPLAQNPDGCVGVCHVRCLPTLWAEASLHMVICVCVYLHICVHVLMYVFGPYSKIWENRCSSVYLFICYLVYACKQHTHELSLVPPEQQVGCCSGSSKVIIMVRVQCLSFSPLG